MVYVVLPRCTYVVYEVVRQLYVVLPHSIDPAPLAAALSWGTSTVQGGRGDVWLTHTRNCFLQDYDIGALAEAWPCVQDFHLNVHCA